MDEKWEWHFCLVIFHVFIFFPPKIDAANVMHPRMQKNGNEFAYGSGLFNPVKAVDTGLVYNASDADYIKLLCKQGYNTTTLKLISNERKNACESSKQGRAWDLNYPSFALAIEDGHEIKCSFIRTGKCSTC